MGVWLAAESGLFVVVYSPVFEAFCSEIYQETHGQAVGDYIVLGLCDMDVFEGG